MTGPIYRLTDLGHDYNGRVGLDLTGRLDFEAGLIHGLVGPNGSGKSTLLKIMAQILAPSRGRAELAGGERFGGLANRRRVTLLHQEPFLLDGTVLKNVCFGLKARGDSRDLAGRAAEAMQAAGLDYDRFAARRSTELSGGEAQRVALASRLILRPEVLLLDEPVASVDAESARLIKAAVVKAAREWGVTLVVASHDLDWLLQTADRILNLHQGRLAGQGVINLLPGPWAPSGGRAMMDLADGTRLSLPRPDGGRTAVLPSRAVELHPPGSTYQSNTLRAVVVSLSSLQSQDRLVVRVRCGDLVLSAQAEPDQLPPGLVPGREVDLTIDPTAVSWI